METIWNRDVQMPQFSALEGDIRTDVLIVGGGLAGLLCAWNLSSAGIECILLEQNRIMEGISGRTTAKITTQHGLIYNRLLRTLGAEKARMYWQANSDALTAFRELAQKADFEFETQNSYLYQRDETRKLEAEMAACEQLKLPARWENSLPLPFPVAGGICFPDQAQFHPLKFAAHIAKGQKIFEKTKALSFLDNRVQTPKGTVTAEKIVVATHFPMLNKHGAYFLKLYQQRSYVIALENGKSMEGMYLDCADNGLSIRSAGRQLLLGGGGHRTGKQGLGWKLPEAAAQRYFPHANTIARWATQDCMTLDGMPYIGRYSRMTPNLFVATGFQKWGMTSSMMAARILTDLIQDRENPYASLFSPSRSMLQKQLFVNGADAAVNLIRPSIPRCPHLGCALQWNREEHSWDCPCHGSRFDRNGTLLNNPATGNLKHPPKKRGD